MIKKTILLFLGLTACLNNYLHGQCSATLSGSPCIGSTITANMVSGQPAILNWQDNGITVNTTYPTWNASANTIAGSVSGTSGKSSTDLNGPNGVFVDLSGNVYIADAINNRVQKWATGALTGTTVAGSAAGTSGSSPSLLNHPTAVFVDNTGNVYIADAGNNRIQKWASGALTGSTVAGNFLGTAGSTPDKLNYPTGLYLDDSSNIYIADYGNQRIQKWASGASSGTTVAGNSGVSGASPGLLKNPKAVYVDALKNIYIADAGNNRIQKWHSGALSGTTVAGNMGGLAGSSAAYLSKPSALYMDANGTVYIADSGNNRIQRWASTDTAGTTAAGSSSGISGVLSTLLFSPLGVYIDANGNLYVGDSKNNRVQKYSMVNSFTYSPASTGNYSLQYNTFSGCNAVSSQMYINALPTASVTSTSTYLCIGSNTAITGTVTGTGRWKLSLNSNDSAKGTGNASFNILVTPSATTTYTVMTLIDSVCTAQVSGLTGSTGVTVYPIPSPIITTNAGSYTICSGNTITLAADTGNYAINLNGTAQYISAADATDLNFGSSTSFTVEGWIKYSTSQASGTGLICKATTGTLTGWQLTLNGNKLSAQGNMMAQVTGTTSLNDGKWHHIALVVSRGGSATATIYVDGVSEGSTVVTGASVTTTGTSLFIGKDRTSTNFFGGSVDEIRIWSLARTATQILNNKAVNLAPVTTGLVAYYKMNESSGTTSADATGSHTLTLSGAPTRTTSLAPVGYAWTPGSFSTPTITVGPSTTTTYTVTLTTAGCSGSANKKVTVLSSPVSVITSSNTGICNGSSTNINGNVTATGSWSLTLSNGATASGSGNGSFSKTVSPTVNTTYSVTSLSDNTGCAPTNTGNEIVTVNAHPTASITGSNATICNGSSANITGTVTANGAWTLTLSSGATGTGNGSGTFSIPVSPSSATTYTIASLSDANCSALAGGITGSQVITVNARPTAVISSTGLGVCNGSSTSVTGTVTGVGAWTMTLNNGSVATGTGNGSFNITVTPTIATTYTISALSDANCTAISADFTGSTPVSILPRPTATITSTPRTLCDGGNTTITGNVSATGIWTLTLSSGGGTFSGSSFSGSFVRTVTPLTSTTYSIVSLSDSVCTSLAGDLNGNTPVTLNTRPTGTITTPNTAICNGGSSSINGSVTALGAWTLTLTDGSTATGTGNGTYTISVNPTITTTYAILSLVDSRCTSLSSDLTGTEVLTVRARPTGAINGSSTNLCKGSGTYISGNVVANGAWTLTLTGGAIATGTGNSTFNISVNPTVTTTYSISALSDAYCTSIPSDLSGSQVITSLTRPTAIITGPTTTLCKGANANITGTVTAVGAWTLALSNSGGSASGTGNGSFSINASPAATTTYTVSTLSDANCTSLASDFSGSSLITVNPINKWTGSVSTDWNTAGNWCGLVPTSTSDVYIPSSATHQPIITSAALCHNLTVGRGASLAVNGAGLSVNGNIVDSGTVSYPSGTLNLVGNTVQTLDGGLQVYNLTVNNTSGVTINGKITVNNVLTLSTGILKADTVIVNNSSTTAVTGHQTNGNSSGFSASSYINGVLKRKVTSSGVYDFPVGTSTNYELISFNHSSLVGVNSLSVQFITSNTGCSSPIGDSIKINGTKVKTLLDAGYWSVLPDAEPVSGTYTAYVNERGYASYPGAASQMSLIKRNACTGTWKALGVHNNNTQFFAYNTAHAERSGLTTFSNFGIGWGDAPLPVTLIDFNAWYTKDGVVDITWHTRNQINNSHFNVQRSADGVTFNTINNIDGCGTCHDTRTYNVTDPQPGYGLQYYRLQMTDFDGQNTYSEIVAVNNTEASSHIRMSVHPNPTNEDAYLDIISSIDTKVVISVQDIMGHVLLTGQEVAGAAKKLVKLPLSGMPNGVYMITVLNTLDGTHTFMRVIKTE